MSAFRPHGAWRPGFLHAHTRCGCMSGLLQRTVLVLNDSDGHADKRTRTLLAQQFATHGLVVIEVPFDSHLRPGGVIDVDNEMSPKTRHYFYEIAAAIADHFSSTIQGRR